MISSPPLLGNKTPSEWIREYLAYFQAVRNEFMLLKTIWFPAQGADLHGLHPGEQVTSGNSAYIGLVIPREVSEIREAVLRFIPTTTGTIDYTVNSTFGGKDEDESASTSTLTADTLSVTDDVVMEIDITSIFSTVDADDQVGVQFTLDAVATTTNVYILGIYLKYR